MSALTIHCASELEATHLRRELPGLDTPIVVAGNGSEVQCHSPPPLSERTRRLIYVGRLSPEKGIDALLVAWSNLKVTNGFELCLVGATSSSYSSHVVRQVQGLLGVSVLPYSSQHRVHELIATSRYLVLCPGLGTAGSVPHMENYGNVVADAAVLGTPSIVSDGLAWDGLVQTGGALSAGTSIETLEAALRRAINLDDAAWSAMSSQAREFGLEHCISERTLSPIVQLLLDPDASPS